MVRVAGAAGKAVRWAAFDSSAAWARVWLQPAAALAEKEKTDTEMVDAEKVDTEKEKTEDKEKKETNERQE